MHNRLALFAASLAASGVLAAGLAFVGLSAAPVPAADSTITAPVTDAPPAPVTQIDTVDLHVDLMAAAQPVGERLHVFDVSRGEPQIAAFLGKGFGRCRADAL